MNMPCVDVVYATAERQLQVFVAYHPAMTVVQAWHISGLESQCPMNEPVFVVGDKVVTEPASHELRAGDRVVCVRPLIADAKELRRQRAKQAATKTTT